MAHITISYRRADSDAIAGRIRDRIAAHFGDESVFMDIDSIPFGFDFREHIQEALAQNDILVAIIGPKWLGPGKGAGLRIMELTDPVRIEIETALKHGSAIIPVLVGGAVMPEPTELPEGLKDLAFRNAAEVDAGRDFNQHMERLIRSMDFILAKKGKAAAAAAAAAPTATDEPAAPVAPPEQIHLADIPRPAPRPAPPPPTPAPTPAAAPAPQYAVPPHAVPPHVPRSRAPWIVAACALVVLGGGAAATGWYFLKGPTANEPTKTTTTTTTTTPPVIEVVQGGGTATSVATGCKLDIPTTFADDFKTSDPGWVLTSQIGYFADGNLVLNALDGRISRALYPPLRFKNVTICAEMKSPPQIGKPDANTDGGVMFWATDNSNFYLASVYPNGTYSIYRMAADTWAPIVARTPFAGVKQGANAINEIRVTTKDNVATMYINGAKAQEIRGQPPKDNSSIGLYGASATGERNEWRMLSVVVADPDRTQPRTVTKAPAPLIAAGCKPSRTVAFEDKFKTLDPGWGVEANTPASFADGQLVLKPRADRAWEQLYPSLLFKSATVCVQVKSPTQMTESDETVNGGLVFWGVNRSNYYTVDIFPTGLIGVYRKVNGNWAKLLPPVKSAAVKSGIGATNELMVSYAGDVAAFFLNGQKAFEFRGQPPQTGGSIGLFASSEKDKENEWRFLNVVVVEGE